MNEAAEFRPSDEQAKAEYDPFGTGARSSEWLSIYVALGTRFPDLRCWTDDRVDLAELSALGLDRGSAAGRFPQLRAAADGQVVSQVAGSHDYLWLGSGAAGHLCGDGNGAAAEQSPHQIHRHLADDLL